LETKSIGFLNGVIHRGAHRFFERELGSLGIHRGMIHILKELARNNGISQRELCDSLSVDKANVARIIGRMESAGLVSRVCCTDDGRMKHLYLTPAGKTVIDPLDCILRRWTGILTRGMNCEEVELLSILLERSITNISEHFSESGAGEK